MDKSNAEELEAARRKGHREGLEEAAAHCGEWGESEVRGETQPPPDGAVAFFSAQRMLECLAEAHEKEEKTSPENSKESIVPETTLNIDPSSQVERLTHLISAEMNLCHEQLTELLGWLLSYLKSKNELKPCLRKLNSHDWIILYTAMIEVEAGL